MKEGVERSENFVLFLSAGVESRPFVHLELRHALALKKKVILVHEEDERHGKFDFSAWKDAPSDLQGALMSHESIAFRRRAWEREAIREQSRELGAPP